MKNLYNLLDNDALDINNTYPGIVVRKGMGLIAGILILFLCVISFIPYPDKIRLESTIDPINKRFIFNTDTSTFKLVKLFLIKGQHVVKHDKLALLVNYNTGQQKDVYAPFSGTFLMSGINNDKISLYVLCQDTLTNNVSFELNTSDCRAMRSRQKVTIEISEGAVPLNGFINSVTPIPLGSKCLIVVSLAPLDRIRLQTKVNKVVLQPIPVTIEVYFNTLTVLHKAFGVLSERFKSI